MRLILLGAPGAGKGTLAARLAQQLSVPHLASGDILRGEIRQGSKLGLSVQKYMDSGDLVPDEIIVGVMAKRLSESDCSQGYILDGFPRTLPQAQALNDELSQASQPIDLVLYLQADADVIVARLAGRRICPLCGANYNIDTLPPAVSGKCDNDGADLQTRPDDQPQIIRERLRKYRQLTQPLLDYYAQAGRFRTLNGSGSIDEVCQETREVLSQEFSSIDEA